MVIPGGVELVGGAAAAGGGLGGGWGRGQEGRRGGGRNADAAVAVVDGESGGGGRAGRWLATRARRPALRRWLQGAAEGSRRGPEWLARAVGVGLIGPASRMAARLSGPVSCERPQKHFRALFF
ncbi:uncharacterized protein LOC131875231 [Cryptomeria japonica]|uniref:uncharacterized protein LOC131875231 n=1 Tax=Cryptomeria japonica TaxID=3369 RepID=UPI0027DA9C77|nr:uncharacterized protein LOC131875231 [Cryptomeria japonica]